MQHLGDITKISGYDVPPVDCVIGGSPCQDLSIAGKREGLAGARSGLFMEQIRIVKELRDADRKRGRSDQLVRPRFMVWENVPGAFSSNKGEDFRAVLEETARVAKPDAVIPGPDGGWRTSGAILGNGWSIAWRVLDAQFWGVPQRRRRIALVADFGGQAAPEILFERKGLRWDSAEGGEAGEAAAGTAEDGAAGASSVRCLNPWDAQSARVYDQDGVFHSLNANENGGMSRDAVLTMRVRCGCEGGGKGALIQVDKSGTLACNNDRVLFCAFTQNQRDEVRDLHGVAGALAAEPGMKQQTYVCAGFKWHQGAEARDIVYEEEVSPTLSVEKNPAVVYCEVKEDDLMQMLSAKNDAPTLFENHGQDSRLKGPLEVSPTVSQKWGTGGNNTPLVMESNRQKAEIFEDKSPTIMAGHERPIIAAVDCRNGEENADVNGTLQAKPSGGSSVNLNNVVRVERTVRRLTPLECERLQGYPDGYTDIGEWTDSKGKKRQTSDAARYKALGNSIALPPWKWVLKRLCACYERDATMASLFDGIGGFPLIWERLNGPGSCRWASEIEEFPIAVTKKWFPDKAVNP